MGYQSEEPVYREGVYQLEITDAGKGGPIDEGGDLNKPLKDLADRTAYLRAVGDPAAAIAHRLAFNVLW